MKYVLLFFLALLQVNGINAQSTNSLETGKQLYANGDFERAIEVLKQSANPEAFLYTGKSYFSIAEFVTASAFYRRAAASETNELKQEAMFSLALSEFQLKNHTNALEVLYELSQASPPTRAKESGRQFYADYVRFLTMADRFNVFKGTKYDQIRFDLIDASLGQIDYESARSLVDELKEVQTELSSFEINKLEEQLSDSLLYWQRYNPSRIYPAPDGISYHIGVALPQFDQNSPQYNIVQSIFFGIQLAVETFNEEHFNKKVFISYANTNIDQPQSALTDLVWNKRVDAVIGPLFSETGILFSEIAEEYEIPLVLPLANSDTLNLDKNYSFQINPTFRIQGERMAQFAVNNLGLDTLAVIAEAGALGAASARSFRFTAEQLGATVLYYFEEDFASLGYDITEFTQFLTTNPLDSLPMAQAVYAPFTGAISQTLISSLLTDLEGLQSSVIVLGSEEWETVDLSSRELLQTSGYYSKSFLEPDSNNVASQSFQSNYRVRFGAEPTSFSSIGFDAANLVLATLLDVQNPALLKDGLKRTVNLKGLSSTISFDGEHINQRVTILPLNRSVELPEVIEE